MLVASLLLAYVLAYAVARWVYRGFEPTVENRYSAWHRVMRDLPEDRDVYATIDLNNGGAVAGWVTGYTVAEVPYSEREVVLSAGRGVALKTRETSGGSFTDMMEPVLIIPGGEIAAMALSYYDR